MNNVLNLHQQKCVTKDGAALTGLSGKKEEGRMNGKQETGSGVEKVVSDGIRWE